MNELPLSLSQLANQLWPRFEDPAEEARFHARQQAEIGRRLAVHAPLAIGFVLCAGIGHVILFPRFVWEPILGLLAVSMLLPLVASWVMAIRMAAPARLYLAMQLTSASAVLGVCLIVASARARGYPLPYEGILLVIMAVFLLGGLRARDAMLIALACLGGLIVIEWVWPTSWHDAVVHSFFGIASWLLGSTFSLLIERADRREFLYHETLRTLALRDPLTGLLNRRGLDERFELLAASARRDGLPVSVAIVDLDYFKTYNDTHGHEAGDSVLVAVSGVLAQHARRPLDVIARMGGEEFLLAWHDADAINGEKLANQVCHDIAALAIEHRGIPATATLPHGSRQAPDSNASSRRPAGVVTASIGVTTAKPMLDSDNLDTLYRQADAALYEAKHAGRNRVCRHARQDEAAGDGTSPAFIAQRNNTSP